MKKKNRMVRKRERQTDRGGRVYSGKEKPFNALLDEMKTPELERIMMYSNAAKLVFLVQFFTILYLDIFSNFHLHIFLFGK